QTEDSEPSGAPRNGSARRGCRSSRDLVHRRCRVSRGRSRGPPVPEPMQGGLKVKRSLFSLALAGLAVMAAVPASAQINTGGITAFERGIFNLAEAYPCSVGTYAGASGITNEQIFTGTCASQDGVPGAAPGILCLRRDPIHTLNLDVNCFAVTPAGEFGCVVQSYRLFKLVPGSFKCPDVYGLPHFDDKGNIIFY